MDNNNGAVQRQQAFRIGREVRSFYIPLEFCYIWVSRSVDLTHHVNVNDIH